MLSAMASTRAVLQVFEKYQKDRVAFVQTVAELATRPQNIEPMQSAGVMALLRPLLLDNVPRYVLWDVLVITGAHEWAKNWGPRKPRRTDGGARSSRPRLFIGHRPSIIRGLKMAQSRPIVHSSPPRLQLPTC